MTELPRPGNRVKAPRPLARLDVVGVDESADAVLAARRARHHLVFHHQRRERPRVTLGIVDHLRLPQQASGLAVEGDRVGVERSHEQPVAEHAQPAVDQPAAGDQLRRQIPRIAPEPRAGLRVERIDVSGRNRDVQHAVERQRGRLELFAHSFLKRPLQPQVLHVFRRDLGQPAVPLPGIPAVIVEPVAGLLLRLDEVAVRNLGRRRRAGQNDAQNRAEIRTDHCAAPFSEPRSEQR